MARLTTDKLQLLKKVFTEDATAVKSPACLIALTQEMSNCAILELQTVADRNNPPVSTDRPRPDS